MIPLVTHPDYSFDFPPGHRFPMEKFRLLHHHLQQLGIAKPDNTFRPGKARKELLELAHCPNYIERFLSNTLTDKEQRRLGLPWSESLAKRTIIAPVGTLLTAQLALRHGIACHLAGGTHHAHYDYGSGFCVLNDLAITAKALLAAGTIGKIVIFDCDVHQGDGTATLLADEPRAFTCSIHCQSNFPPLKAVSDLDVGLPPNTEDSEYLHTVRKTLLKLIAEQKPDLILYDAGVDVFTGDPLGRLNITMTGLAQREMLVLNICKAAGIPVATVIGGGYDDDRAALTQRHASVIETAFSLYN